VRHDAEWGMVYSPHAPYEVLGTKHVDFPTMQRLRRFSRYWDLVANSGNFTETTPLIWGDASAFESFMRLSDALHERFGTGRGIALHRLAEFVFNYLGAGARVAGALWRDYQRGGRVDCPEFLRDHMPESERRARAKPASITGPPRQARHLV
jgi:hypothetical protein